MYLPSDEIFSKYADVLVKFALNSGQGIKSGEVVLLTVPSSAYQFLPYLQKSVMQSGGHYLTNLVPDFSEPQLKTDKQFFTLANQEQLNFFPDKYYRGLIDQIDHTINVLAQADLHHLKDIDSAKIIARQQSHKPYMEWRQDKEYQGKFTWTLALFGTPAMASEAGLTQEEYWQQIISGCYLDQPDPIQSWQTAQSHIDQIRIQLNSLPISHLRIQAQNTDLTITLGEHRQWLGGGGRNIPSFEIFTSPDWRGTNGHITFNQPLYIHGQKVTDVSLEFQNGIVVNSSAKEGQDFLHQMISASNADKIGEFSLTDSRFSKITKFMAHTLFDENMGGEQGNTHIALGQAYKDTCTLPYVEVSPDQWDKLGFNNSAIHTDIISTTSRTVTATLIDGTTKIIYQDGRFTL